jgi:hypothetical protein
MKEGFWGLLWGTVVAFLATGRWMAFLAAGEHLILDEPTAIPMLPAGTLTLHVPYAQAVQECPFPLRSAFLPVVFV